jgi:hypothetical protein
MALTATFALCAAVTIVSDGPDERQRTLMAILFAMASCYFLSLTLVAHARRRSPRTRDSMMGMMAPAMGYASAIPAAIAVPLTVVDAATPVVGPIAPPLAILSAMASVFVLMLLARALEIRIDPPRASMDATADSGAFVASPVREVRDMP